MTIAIIFIIQHGYNKLLQGCQPESVSDLVNNKQKYSAVSHYHNHHHHHHHHHNRLPSQIPTLELPYGGQFWGWAILSTSVIRIAHLNYKVLLCNVCAVYCFHVSANQLDCVSQIFRPTSKQRKTTAMISQVIYSLCSGLNRNTPSVSGRDIWESCDVEGRPTPGSGNQAWGTCGPTPGWGTDTWAAGTAWSWR